MKKVLFVIVLFFVSLSLNAAEMSIKFYLQDENFKQCKLSDISEITVIKSAVPYMMEIYIYGGKTTYDLNDVTSIGFTTSPLNLVIFRSNTTNLHEILKIDSINFVPKTANEIPIGPFTWMGQNLDVEYYRNGDPIPQVTDSAEWINLQTGAWCFYDNDPAMGAIYGKLYNWYAVSDPRGLAPDGWHIPSYDEWIKLSTSLGGDTLAGGKLKSIGTKENGDGLWQTPNEGATNETKFSALPGGYRYDSFLNINIGATYWSLSEEEMFTKIKIRNLYCSNKDFSKSYGSKACGFSVRCIKDYIPPSIKSIFPNSGMVGKEITITGINFGAERKDNYVAFGLTKLGNSDYISWSDTEIKLVIPEDAKSGYVYVWVGGIESNYVEFVITKTDPDYFEPITIGTQVWMSRNLNVDRYRNGDTIQQIKNYSDLNNLKTGAWCYYNFRVENEELYGKLYNWYAVNDPRGLAPEGWHVASDDDWKVLTDYLGDTTLAGGKMKTTGNLKDNTGLWKAPNFGATNESGFSALPGGKTAVNAFQMINFFGYWWTSSESDENIAWYRNISNMSSSCSRLNENKGSGFSVRCIKD